MRIVSLKRLFIVLISPLLLLSLLSCAMSALQTPLVTPKDNLNFSASAVFTDEVTDPSLNVPVWVSSSFRYGIIENLESGLVIFGDALIADAKYGIIQNRTSGLNFAIRGGAGYGFYTLSYTDIEPIVGWNYQDIALPYASLRTMAHWQHMIYKISPAIGVSFLPNNDLSIITETRFYLTLPGSNQYSDINIPNEYTPGQEVYVPKDNFFSFHLGVSLKFDPFTYY
jgi:hypothetical protein